MSIHPIHRPEAVYGQPEIHTPYPAEPLNYPPYFNNPGDDPDHESLTGETKGDETSAEEKAMSDTIFSDFVLDRIGIGPIQSVLRAQYHLSLETELTRVLLPIPRSAAEEKELHEDVMASLRKLVEKLEEDELFESSMKQFTQRSSMAVDVSGGAGGGGLMVASGNMMTHLEGEPNAAGLGDQPRTRDVRELLMADVRQTLAREREKQKEREEREGEKEDTV